MAVGRALGSGVGRAVVGLSVGTPLGMSVGNAEGLGVGTGEGTGVIMQTARVASLVRLVKGGLVRQVGRQARPTLEEISSGFIEVLKLQNETGTTDVNLLLLKPKYCRFVSKPSCEGMLKTRLLPDRPKYCSLVSRPNCEGIDELRLLLARSKYVSAPRLPIVVGRLPVRPLLDADKRTTRFSPPTTAQVTPAQAPEQGS